MLSNLDLKKKYTMEICLNNKSFNKENRIYNHRLYEVRIDQFDNEMKKNDFKKDKKHYYWMTMDQMQNDSEIQKKNLDVIDFVKEVGK